MTTRCSTPRSPTWSGTPPPAGGSCGPTGVTSSRRSSSRWARARCTCAKLPGIPGIETFGGHSFHTSRWDYAYTGGDPDGAPMDRLADKRVAIIGTGATAVQCVPHLAHACQELFVFQRTPSSVDVRGNQPMDPRVVRGRGHAGLAGPLAGQLRRQHVGRRVCRPRTW